MRGNRDWAGTSLPLFIYMHPPSHHQNAAPDVTQHRLEKQWLKLWEPICKLCSSVIKVSHSPKRLPLMLFWISLKFASAQIQTLTSEMHKVSLLRPLLTVVCWETALFAMYLTLPPILRALRLLDDPDAVALPKVQVARSETIKVVHGSHILALERSYLLWRWWRRLLLPCCWVGRGRVARGGSVRGMRRDFVDVEVVVTVSTIRVGRRHGR
jgi:hypothetical protein